MHGSAREVNRIQARAQSPVYALFAESVSGQLPTHKKATETMRIFWNCLCTVLLVATDWSL